MGASQSGKKLTPVLPLDRAVFGENGIGTAFGTKSQFSTPFSLYDRYRGTTVKDSIRYPMKISQDGVSASGVYDTFDIRHYFDAEETYPRTITTDFTFEPYDWWSLCSFATNSSEYYFTEVTYYYQNAVIRDDYLLAYHAIGLDSGISESTINNLRLTVDYSYSVRTDTYSDVCKGTKTFSVREYSPADNAIFTFGIRELFDEEYWNASGSYYYIGGLKMRVYFTSTDGNEVSPLTTDGFYNIRDRYIYTSEFNDIQLNHMPVAYTPPESVNASGLFSWVVDAMTGLFNAPLIPVGDFSISVGSLVGVVVGLLLVFAFLRFFSGG